VQDDRSFAQLTRADAAKEIVARALKDLELRAQLFREGAREGYPPALRALHRANAEDLIALVGAHGWPMSDIDGPEAAEAAFLIAQHVIGEPPLMRELLALISDAVESSRAPAWQMAVLADRIAVFEGRGQIFGTHFDWDDAGALSPSPIADAEHVDQRREMVALTPLAEEIARQREDAARDGERAPADLAAHRERQAAFARDAGWRT